MLINLLLFLKLVPFVFLGKISPFGRKPILLSVNNENKYSTYTFSFFIETDLDKGFKLYF